MDNKQNKTFAQRAQTIIKSYKRADWDNIEKAALESSLEKLQQEQEAYKQSNQIGEYACGGKMHAYGDVLTEAVDTEEEMQVEPWMSDLSTWNTNTAPSGTADQSQFTPYKTSIAPSLISGATSVLGNMYLANQQGNTPEVNLPQVSAPTISLERGRQAAIREATKAGQNVKYATKGAARTRGEYMANRLASESQITGRLGETLSASHEKEALINANMKAGMDRFNAELKAKEEIINKANKIKDKKEREAYLAAAIGTVPQTVRDINQIKAQDNLISSLGQDYGWYMYNQPDRKWYQPKQRKIAYRGNNGLQLAQ